MAYIGLSPVTNFLTTFSERFSGDSNTKQFVLSRPVSRAEDLEVFIGESQQLPSTFTASGVLLTFTEAPVFGVDNITVIYRAGALQTLDTLRVGNPAGTASSPSLYYTNGTDTGIYWPSSSKLGFSALGVSRVVIDALTNSISTTTGALQVAGGVGITGNTYIGGDVRILDTTESSSTGTGALTVSGGVGIAKNLNVNGDIQVTGDFTVAGTFTTTASDSLSINDPFLFLATDNSGDSVDTGFVAKYNDGTARYTGLFRDVTTGKYNLFDNLTNAPTTTVDTGNVSYRYADLLLQSLTSSGVVLLTSGVNASSTTTGALQVTGGIGATGDIYATGLNLNSGSIVSTGSIGNVSSVTTSGTIQTIGRIYANANIISAGATIGSIVVPGNGGIGVGGNVTVGGNLNASSGNVYTRSVNSTGNIIVTGGLTINSLGLATAIVNSGTNGVGNIGASGAGFNTIFAKATTAQYADIAENYSSDSFYEPGTVLAFGGTEEVTQSNVDHDIRVAGVVSTNPAHLMNDRLTSKHTIALALLGRVPTKVTGSIKKGDMLVSAGNGHARSESNPRSGAIIGKSLEDFEGISGKIEVVIGRL